MPSMQDPWNTTPAWGFHYYSSEPAPAPTAETYLQMAMGNVAGLGAYALYNKLIYAEISFYHSSPAGMSFPPDNTWMGNIDGAAPYWRLAIQHQWGSQYIEVGTFGIASNIYPQCIGCRYCMANCPYTIKVFNWFKDEQPVEYEKCYNIDVSVRPKGIVEKCTFCIHRLQKAKEKAKAEHRKMKEEDYVSACAEVCPAKAIYFGDLDDPPSKVAKAMHDYRRFALQEDLGTEPKVRYLSEKSQ